MRSTRAAEPVSELGPLDRPMAGPVAIVVTRELTAEERAWLDSYVRHASTAVEGDSFWVPPRDAPAADPADSRPFIWSVGPFQEPGGEEIRRRFGFDPRIEVVFAAMCNSDEDHRLLARLCEAAARQLHGVIDFTGHLPGAPSSVDESQLLDVGDRHVGTPDFLATWSANPAFWMVK